MTKTTKISIRLIPLCLLLFFAWGVSTAAAVETITTGWASTPPTIDGSMTAGEWDNAVQVSGTGSIPFTGYLMSDTTHLYIAYVIDDPDPEAADQFQIAFDTDNDDTWMEGCTNTNDGDFLAHYDGSVTYRIIEYRYTDAGLYGCSSTTSTSMTASASPAVKSVIHWEIVVDLTGGELYGAPGETVISISPVGLQQGPLPTRLLGRT